MHTPVVNATLACLGLYVATAAEPELKAELLAADRAFAKAAAEKGLDGWLSFMADDTARLTKLGDKIAAGKDAIRKLDAPLFANPNRKLTWEPTDAHTFADGKSGLTTGRYQIAGPGDDGKPKVWSRGGYVTWWRKEADGAWKVVFDTGSADSSPPTSSPTP